MLLETTPEYQGVKKQIQRQVNLGNFFYSEVEW